MKYATTMKILLWVILAESIGLVILLTYSI